MENCRVSSAPLFCGIDLARRIERAEANFMVAATEAAGARGGRGLVLPLGGGFAVSADDGSPMNKVVGLGFDHIPDGEALDEVERIFAEFDAPVQVELATLANPEIAGMLTGRGYLLAGFEDVLGRALDDEIAASDTGIELYSGTRVDLDAWIDTILDGFTSPDGAGVPSHEDFPRDVIAQAERDIEKAGATPYVALCDGVVAGAASLRITDRIAQLTGAATRPDYRRRGAHVALLVERLRDAQRAGCDIAVVTTAPGSASQKNLQRNGFHLLYTRAVLVREPRNG